MPNLEDALTLLRSARESLEAGHVEDAAWLLEAVEEDLAAVAASKKLGFSNAERSARY